MLKDEESSFLKPTDFKNILDLVSHCATRQTKNPGTNTCGLLLVFKGSTAGLRPEESGIEVGG